MSHGSSQLSSVLIRIPSLGLGQPPSPLLGEQHQVQQRGRRHLRQQEGHLRRFSREGRNL